MAWKDKDSKENTPLPPSLSQERNPSLETPNTSLDRDDALKRFIPCPLKSTIARIDAKFHPDPIPH